MRARAARVHDALRNALVIEVRDLFAQDEVFEQRRTAQARLERILVVRDGHALIGRERAIRRSRRARDRAGRWTGLKLICGLPLPTFGEALVSVSVLPETRGCGGSTVWPAAGTRRLAEFARLGGVERKLRRDVFGAASFAVAASWMADTPDDGPLTVDRALEAPA